MNIALKLYRIGFTALFTLVFGVNQPLSAVELLHQEEIPLEFVLDEIQNLPPKVTSQKTPQVDNVHVAHTCPRTKKKRCYDYVIVGLGTSGAVLARCLSNPVDGKFKNSVFVIEAGSNYSTDPAVLAPVQLGDTFDTKYTNSAAVRSTAVNQVLEISYGQLCGGSSGHNGFVATRGSPQRYDQWAVASGDTRWTYNNLLPFMRALEDYTPNGTTADLTQRGDSGPLSILQTQTPPPVNDPFTQAMLTVFNPIGTPVPYVADLNAGVSTGISRTQSTLKLPPTIVRAFSMDFLPTSIMTPDGHGVAGRKLEVELQAKATRVLFKQGTTQAIGMEYVHQNNPEEVLQVYARKKVILCAGPMSCAILQHSGIGPINVLNDALISPILVNNPNVGNGFINQPRTVALMLLPQGVTGQVLQANVSGYPYFTSNASDLTTANLQISAVPASNFPRNPLAVVSPLTPALTDPRYRAFFIIQSQPGSKGSILVRDDDPLNWPTVNFNFFANGGPSVQGTDANAMVSGYKLVRDIATQLGATMVFPPAAHFTAGNADQLLFDDAKAAFSNLHHYTGACNMGLSINDPLYPGVVDGRLHVFGTTNLMVVDNSVVPVPTASHPQLEAYVIGMQGANILGAQL